MPRIALAEKIMHRTSFIPTKNYNLLAKRRNFILTIYKHRDSYFIIQCTTIATAGKDGVCGQIDSPNLIRHAVFIL